MSNTSLSSLSVAQLRRAIDIREKIAALETELAGISGESDQSPSTSVAPKGKRKMSAAAKAKISAAAKARWAKVRSAKGQPAAKVTTKPKRKMSAAGRARLVAAVKARWAKVRAAKGK